MKEVEASKILTSPDYLLTRLDLKQGNYIFTQVEPRTYTDSPILDMRVESLRDREIALKFSHVDALLEQHEGPSTAPRYIFHPAFTGSTLLAGALQKPGEVLSLREPSILGEVADLKRQMIFHNNFDERNWPAFVARIVKLLSKTYSGAEKPLIKPTNIANNLINDLLRAHPDSRGVYLYTDMDSFICANLNQPEETKRTVHVLATVFGRDLGLEDWMKETDFYRLGHLQAVVALWYIQHRQLLEELKHSVGRLTPVYSKDLFGKPSDTLKSINRDLNLGLSQEFLSGVSDSDLFQKEAKHTASSYEGNSRAEGYEALAHQFSEEIAQAKQWFDEATGRKMSSDAIMEKIATYRES